jgi:hypothetical protein
MDESSERSVSASMWHPPHPPSPIPSTIYDLPHYHLPSTIHHRVLLPSPPVSIFGGGHADDGSGTHSGLRESGIYLI